MKVASNVLALTLLCVPSAAFAPSAFSRTLRPSSSRSMAIDPAAIHDLSNHVGAISEAFSSSVVISDLTDVATQAITSGSVDNVAATVGTAAAPAAVEAAQDNGWFGFLTGPIEGLLNIIHGVLVSMGMDKDAWGVSIVGMTVFIKILTYPLTKQQLESTSRMQALQPQIKEIQNKYQSNPEVMNQKVAEIYQTNDVNPLAGCIPSFIQIPVFIGLYRAILDLAKMDRLEEPFLWLPNLEGPTYGADPGSASDWLFKNWANGVPSLGWDDTLAFLSLPVILVISQFLSINIMQPKNQTQEQPFIIKLLPLLIGWFSLNVPAALGIYWVANNFITTALSLQIRAGIKDPVMPSSSGAAVMDVPASTFTPAPLREKPAGFGGEGAVDDITPITPIDAEVIADVSESVTSEEARPSKKRGGKKKKKRRN
uniref:Membrane insertase YidC/Oxa/ALB C-terminal domain-containing protein n=1 Tax=Trieres chinensis TaxID=1514140 RepID=A0A7S2EB53_TRICV|mmetsp:Transcript_15758/g.32286  ORF Transcript_15758/g.32286 Transcript_15758/m.32286 type:complete len:426 (+) Transcript_15758:99-1376(+)